MANENRDLNLTFTFRGKVLSVRIKAGSTLRELGEQLQLVTDVAPYTIKLLVPQARHTALQPFSEEHAMLKLRDCGIEEGKTIRMMGAFLKEVKEVSEPSFKDRTIDFDEEERRARERVTPLARSVKLPQGPYVFGGFRTLQLPGVEMTPPPSTALELMHSLASDKGIVAIMNKHRWRVGIMTEMAPEGLVGISPKCLLGLNKNHGEEISLRLRTDDLKGFRKYESIKRTLLHELAHMVYGEHDDNFYRLDRQLNKEAMELDWTRSKAHTLSGMKYQVTEKVNSDSNLQSPQKGYRLGGASVPMNAKVAAASAALNRFHTKAEPDPDDGQQKEPDPDDELQDGAKMPNSLKFEPDPDEGKLEMEPDSDDQLNAEPDPDDNMEAEPDPDEKLEVEPDPDEGLEVEPDPDDSNDKVKTEPDPDDKSEAEPDPDEKSETEPGIIKVEHQEPDPDERPEHEPDPDDKMELEPDPDEKSENSLQGLDAELERIHDATAAASLRMQQSIAKLKSQASPTEANIALGTLLKILSNVMEHPEEEKYRRLKKENPVFHQRVARFESALELLKTVGFSEEARGSLVLKNNDPGLLWLARSSLESVA